MFGLRLSSRRAGSGAKIELAAAAAAKALAYCGVGVWHLRRAAPAARVGHELNRPKKGRSNLFSLLTCTS
jgi:hypothetical protein